MKNNQCLYLGITSPQVTALSVLPKTMRLVILLMLLLTMAPGCSLLSPYIKAVDVSQIESVRDISKWQARGKMMIAGNGEKVSGYFYWQQNGDSFSFSLNTLIGINLFEINVDEAGTTLTVDGKTHKDDSAENLVARLTGYDLPISQLRWWVLGETATNKPLNNPRGASAKSKQPIVVPYGKQNWTIRYQSWQPVNQFSLPKSMDVRSTNNRIKLSINQWLIEG